MGTNRAIGIRTLDRGKATPLILWTRADGISGKLPRSVVTESARVGGGSIIKVEHVRVTDAGGRAIEGPAKLE